MSKDNKVQVPHDTFFRAAFSDMVIAKDFLGNYLPSDILKHVDLNTLEPQKDSHVDQDLRTHYSDMLYRAEIAGKEGYIYMLTEHKSYNDKMSILQLLRYMVNIWEDKVGKEGVDELPMIFPMLVYHNKGEWKAHMKLSDWIKDYSSFPDEVKKYVPDYEYQLHDLGKYVEDNVAKDIRTKLVIEILDKCRYVSKAEILGLISEGVKLRAELRVKGESTGFLSAFVAYPLGVRDDLDIEEVSRLASSITEDGGEFIMTVAEQLRQEGKIETAREMLRDGLPVETVAKYTKLSLEEVNQIKKEQAKK